MAIGNPQVLALARSWSFPANLFANALRFDFMTRYLRLLSHRLIGARDGPKWLQTDLDLARDADISFLLHD